ncbi:hypothetical protein SAMN02910344_00881 [Ruminobacter amylophilus]|uniref:Uncharacterized protein n=1 Tax=Ruminobacter amylophilus TaxID=867 RepID=A0A662ZHU5_9GAMM|nr:hypothetical protein SAMN02910344_00881 [Ruminobacter amylophilus]
MTDFPSVTQQQPSFMLFYTAGMRLSDGKHRYFDKIKTGKSLKTVINNTKRVYNAFSFKSLAQRIKCINYPIIYIITIIVLNSLSGGVVYFLEDFLPGVP